MIDAQYFLDNYMLGAIDTNSDKPVLISVNQLIKLLDNYYTLKSKEEPNK